MTATNDQIDQDVKKVGISLGTTVIGGLLLLALSGLYGFNEILLSHLMQIFFHVGNVVLQRVHD